MLHRACLNALDRLGQFREQLAACFAKSADHGEADLTFSPRPELYPSVTASKPSTTTSSQSCAVPLCKRQFTMLLGAFCLYFRSKLIPSFYPIRLASESTPPIPAWRSCLSNFDFGTDRQYGRIVRGSVIVFPTWSVSINRCIHAIRIPVQTTASLGLCPSR
mgnify:CR=1 FL=1